MAEEILDLSALAPERQLVRIRTKEDPDGTLYELLHPDELGVAETHSFATLGRRVQSLWVKKTLTAKDRDELDRALTKIVRFVLPGCPPEIIDRLSDIQKSRVSIQFTKQMPEDVVKNAAAAVEELIGESASRPSNASTAGTPAAGI